MTENKLRGNAGWLAALVLGAFWLGSAVPLRTANTADIQRTQSSTADVQREEPKATFLAGDERSLPVLKEIAATVKQIDARLERIEKSLAERSKP
jgi:hypothetical protein